MMIRKFASIHALEVLFRRLVGISVFAAQRKPHALSVMQEDPAFFQYQWLQSKNDHLDVRLESIQNDFRIRGWYKKHLIEMALRKIMGDDCSIIFSVVDIIEKMPTGKQLHVVPLASG
jgi:hypothetical protein